RGAALGGALRDARARRDLAVRRRRRAGAAPRDLRRGRLRRGALPPRPRRRLAGPSLPPAPPPPLVISGAVDYPAALCRLARAAGWRPFVCDPRSQFATAARFPHAEDVIVAWPE